MMDWIGSVKHTYQHIYKPKKFRNKKKKMNRIEQHQLKQKIIMINLDYHLFVFVIPSDLFIYLFIHSFIHEAIAYNIHSHTHAEEPPKRIDFLHWVNNACYHP